MSSKNAYFLQRLNEHVQYLRRVNATLKGEDHFQGKAHTECKLGQWLYGTGEQLLQINAVTQELFTMIEGKHHAFHEASDQALALHHAGDHVNSYRAMTTMLKVSGELVNLLLTADQQAATQGAAA